MSAFREFYQKTFERLAVRAAAYNESLKREEQKLLAPFFDMMADLNEGGKMLRGVLVVLGYQIASRAAADGRQIAEASGAEGGTDEDPAPDGGLAAADDAALAFEIFQTGVLIHDDIIDRARTRRGKPTMTVRYEESLKERRMAAPSQSGHLAESAAICAGDYLITASNLILTRACGTHPRGAAVIRAFDEVILDTIRGELLDVVLPMEMTDPARSKEEADALLHKAVNDIYHLKTARYSVIGPLHLGLLLGGMHKDQTAQLDAMADDLGIAFQIKDDLLGIYADEQELGKDIGSDISEFKQTVLYAYVRMREPEAYKQLLTVYGKPAITFEELQMVQQLFEDCGARRFAETEMERHFASAERAVDAMTFVDERDKAILKEFISYNRERRK